MTDALDPIRDLLRRAAEWTDDGGGGPQPHTVAAVAAEGLVARVDARSIIDRLCAVVEKTLEVITDPPPEWTGIDDRCWRNDMRHLSNELHAVLCRGCDVSDGVHGDSARRNSSEIPSSEVDDEGFELLSDGRHVHSQSRVRLTHRHRHDGRHGYWGHPDDVVISEVKIDWPEPPSEAARKSSENPSAQPDAVDGYLDALAEAGAAFDKVRETVRREQAAQLLAEFEAEHGTITQAEIDAVETPSSE